MSEYTPTTEQVRDHFAWGLMDDSFLTAPQAAEAFDRWLAQVRAEALKEAISECADLLDHSGDTRWFKRMNDIADRAEKRGSHE